MLTDGGMQKGITNVGRLAVSCKTKHILRNYLMPYDIVIVFFDIYSKELGNECPHKNLHEEFTAALFIIGKTCNPDALYR